MPNEDTEVVEVVEETYEEETPIEVETTEETKVEKTEGEKPKRTPQQELEYFEGRAQRLRKDLGIEATTKETKSKKSDDFGYDVKAYLKTSGIDSKEFDFVKNEFQSSGFKDIDSLLENDYFKSRLDTHRKLSKTAEATPTGKRSGGVATDTVEYWLTKPIEDVPADMRIKVVNKKLEREKGKGVFYNS